MGQDLKDAWEAEGNTKATHAFEDGFRVEERSIALWLDAVVIIGDPVLCGEFTNESRHCRLHLLQLLWGAPSVNGLHNGGPNIPQHTKLELFLGEALNKLGFLFLGEMFSCQRRNISLLLHQVF